MQTLMDILNNKITTMDKDSLADIPEELLKVLNRIAKANDKNKQIINETISKNLEKTSE
jgi:hypothetical protein